MIWMLAAERLGGADHDGDLVRTIADPILNAAVLRNYHYNHYVEDMNLTTAASKGNEETQDKKGAKDEEFFLFAQEKDWRKKLNPHTLHRVGVLVEDYKSCLKRIRSGLAEQPILFRPQTHISEAGQLSVVKALSRQVSHHGKVCDGFGQVHKAAALRNTGKSLRQGAFDAEPHGSIPAELPRVQFRISAA